MGGLRSVRFKLTLLVLGSMAPVLVGVLLSGSAARQKLLEQAAEAIDGTNERFEAILDDALKGTRAPVALAAENPELSRLVRAGDKDGAARFVAPLVKAYRKRVVLLSDERGAIIAAGNPERGPVSLSSAGSPAFADLLVGRELQGLVPVATSAGQTYALVTALPLAAEGGGAVGAVAVLSPVTDAYLGYLGRRLDADLSLRVSGVTVASTKGAPKVSGSVGQLAFEERGEQLFATKTFRPEALQRPGMVVELTASRDVSGLRAQANAALARSLSVLGGLTLVVLALALRFARRLGQAVLGISSAAEEVKHGRYVTAPVLKTGDELEALTLHFNEMVEGLKERDRLKETFGRYVTRQVADHLMKGEQQLGGELVPVTVLFSDIRSFTSISEAMEPRALLDFLNEYFAGMVESVLHHQGVVDKFIGDAIMAVFGAPVPEPEDPLRAVKAALEMRRRLEDINRGFLARGLPEIRAGIGLHSGQVVAGNMGHSERMEYTVIGDTVNLASRLEGMTKELGCDVVVSEDLYVQVKDKVEAEPLRKIKVKGRDQEVMVYRLIGLRPGFEG